MPTSHPTFGPGDALLVVDPQRDFCPGGALGVPDGDAVMPLINELSSWFAQAGLPVIVSRDWHPPRTTHFAAYGGVWPPHCVRDTPGAEFHPDLRLPAGTIFVSKGMGETDDAYSAFQARDAAGNSVAGLLTDRAVRHLYVVGLATDYCVKASTLDAVRLGLSASVFRAGVRAVNLKPDDGNNALAEMQAAGVELI
jgi:nicotinamidase/pyrazinamidase